MCSSADPAWVCLRREEPELFHSLVKMHLSMLLDLSTDEDGPAPGSHAPKEGGLKRRLFTPKKKGNRGVMEGAALTQEGVCQVFQLMAFVGLEPHLGVEGVFRKHGNLKKQQLLKERLNAGVAVDLADGTFTVHECAAVLKSFLADLAEPLLGQAHFRAHAQVGQMRAPGRQMEAKRMACLQLLFLLLPAPHYGLLRDLLRLLGRVAARQAQNLMSAANLGTMFAPLILCPRQLSAEAMRSNHRWLAESVAFMIEHEARLFELPAPLRDDVRSHGLARPHGTPPVRDDNEDAQSPVVHTIFTFVDREETHRVTDAFSSETAVAELYAHIQGMPESAQKRRLVSRLNEANGHGTPGIIRTGASRLRAGSEGIRHLLTPRRSAPPSQGKLGRNGSYSFKTPSGQGQMLHSFRRKPAVDVASSQKLLSPQSSPAIVAPFRRPSDSLDGSYVAPDTPQAPTRDPARPPPPVPMRLSSLESAREDSPITSYAQSMPTAMKASMMTPRCRQPVMGGGSMLEVDRQPEAHMDSPCHPQKYNEDEPEEVVDRMPPAEEDAESPPDDSDDYFAALASSDEEGEPDPVSQTCSTHESLREDFHRYLEEHDIIQSPPPVEEPTNLDHSAVSVTSSVISHEARAILNGDVELSDSMHAILNGDSPDRPHFGDAAITPSVLIPVNVDSSYSDKENDSFHSTSSPGSLCTQPTDIPLPAVDRGIREIATQVLELSAPDSSGPKSRRRRSLTETAELNPIARRKALTNAPSNIYFETDL